MQTYFRNPGPSWLSRAVAACLWLASSLASAQQSYEGSGVVTSAKCAGASVFRDQTGNSFEIDNSRVTLPKGTPLTIRGKIYPRISVCKVFPWLDVSGSSFGDLSARSSGAGSSEGASVGTAEQGVIELSLVRQDFAGAVPWLSRLAARTDVSKIRIQIPDTAADQIPRLIMALRSAAPAAITKTEISLANSRRQTFSWSDQGTKKNYGSFSEIRNALNF